MIRDKDTEAGIADAIIKVDDIDHHIRSGGLSPSSHAHFFASGNYLRRKPQNDVVKLHLEGTAGICYERCRPKKPTTNL